MRAIAIATLVLFFLGTLYAACFLFTLLREGLWTLR